MHTRSSIRRGLLALGIASAALLAGFRPFTPVQSVCDKCPIKGDRITMTDGSIVVAKVIAKNQDGVVLELYGELRFVQTREMTRIDFDGGAEPKGLDQYDQILIRNAEQTVLHGTLIQIEAGKPLALRSPRGQVYMVSPEQVLVYYHHGKRRAPAEAKEG